MVFPRVEDTAGNTKAAEKEVAAWRKDLAPFEVGLVHGKVPVEERNRLVVLADRRGRVLWLPEVGARAEAAGLHLRLVREEA